MAGLLLSLPGCGLASRQLFLGLDFATLRKEQADAAPLRSVDPTVPGLWLYDAGRAAQAEEGQDGEEAALALVQRGLAFRPGDSSLLGARIELLAGLGRHEEALAALDEALAGLPPVGFEIGLRHQRVIVLLALERLDEAADEATRLGGLPFVPGGLLADAFSRVALAREAFAQAAEADAALDRALAAEPRGVSGLRRLVLATPERAAALTTLLRRAAERHPRHPDVQLERALDVLTRGDLERGEALLDALPAPLPPRLAVRVELHRANAALAAGRIDEGAARLMARLDVAPADLEALSLLLEVWQRTGQPPTHLVQGYVLRARHAAPRDTIAKLDAVLSALESAQPEPARTPDGPPESAPAPAPDDEGTGGEATGGDTASQSRRSGG